MKAKRIRTGKKKGIGEPDEFQSMTQRALAYLQANMKKTYIALGALGAAVILTVLVSSVFEQSKQNLHLKQTEALAYYDLEGAVPGGKPMSADERLKKARELFAEIAEEGGDSTVAQEARYYLANTDMALGDMDSAIAGYVKLLGGTTDPMLRALANHRLAAAYLARGETEKAMGAYAENAKAEGGYLADEAHYRMGELYEKVGKTGEAVTEYRMVEEVSPVSPWLSEARARITALGGDETPEAKPEAGTGAATDAGAKPGMEEAASAGEKKAE